MYIYLKRDKDKRESYSYIRCDMLMKIAADTFRLAEKHI